MNFKKYPAIHTKTGAFEGDYEAIEDALCEGVIHVWQVGQNMIMARNFIIIRYDVVVIFPKQTGIMFHLGSYREKSEAEKVKERFLERQTIIKAERKAKLAEKRARGRAMTKEVREEMRRVWAMSPEEQTEYWAEKDRKFTEQIREWEEKLTKMRNEQQV